MQHMMAPSHTYRPTCGPHPDFSAAFLTGNDSFGTMIYARCGRRVCTDFVKRQAGGNHVVETQRPDDRLLPFDRHAADSGTAQARMDFEDL